MAELRRVLMPRPGHEQRQKIHVLRGLGGMGKTQLTVEFARRHHRRFSSVFWLDGRSEDILKRSIASHASRIPQGQISETSRTYAGDSSADVDAVVKDVMAWLARPGNTAWLLIFDNVDREYKAQGGDPDAYDVQRYLSGADHGSVLVTTRLVRLEQLGESQQLGKVSKEQAQAIFESWYKQKHGKLRAANSLMRAITTNERIVDAAEGEQLLARLDGLPLAIAQAGAYLEESGVELALYLSFYEQQWSKLMESDHLADAPLQDYPNRSVWTTWAISYQAIRDKHEATANLLLLWSFLDNKDLWHGLFATACGKSTIAARMLSGWIGDIAGSELEFSRAMQLLRNYSLVEKVAETRSYATHPVVHQWAHHSQGKHFATKLIQLAVVTVSLSVPESSTRDYATLQRRLLPHAQTCSGYIVKMEAGWWLTADKEADGGMDGKEERETVLDAMHLLGVLYYSQDKLGKAEQMYDRALRGREEALGPTHTSTLMTVNNLGLLYRDQGKLDKAEQMYERALRGYEEALGPTHTSTLMTVNNLGDLYRDRDKLDKAEQMFERALRGYEEALGPNHTSTLMTVNNLGNLYRDQGKLDKAEQMYERALRGWKEALGPNHTSTLMTVHNLGALYADQGKLDEAEQMYERALRGCEEALGPSHTSTLDTVKNLGALYYSQGKLDKAEQMYERALRGYEEALGPTHTSTLQTVNNLGNLYADQDKVDKAEQMYERALRGKEEALGPTHTSTLGTVNNLGNLYAHQGKLDEAEEMYERALRGYEEALGEERVQQYMPALDTLENIGDLRVKRGETAEAQAVYTKALSGLRSVLGQSSDRCTDLAAKMDALTISQSGKTEHQSLSEASKGLTLQHDKREKSSRFSLRKLVSILTVLFALYLYTLYTL
jgi:tetratricopeptide (TPR) repeat protein